MNAECRILLIRRLDGMVFVLTQVDNNALTLSMGLRCYMMVVRNKNDKLYVKNF